MKMLHDFAVARAAAQHCSQLTANGAGRGPSPEQAAASLAAWRRDLARALAEDLSPILSGDRLDVTISEPEPMSGDAALARIGAVAANCLIRCGGSGGETALLSFDFGTATALTDRAFGGDGKPLGSIPDVLPRSAALMIGEVAAIIAQAITRISYGDAPPPLGTALATTLAATLATASGGEVMIRSESAARLKAFDPDTPCVVAAIIIANRHGCEWRATLAMATQRLERLLPGAGGTVCAQTAAHTPATGPATGLAAPFAQMPLPLRVVLAEFDLSLARLQTLTPGDHIPLAMGRQVPLMVGERVLGHGSIGTAENRMAIRLTSLPVPAEGFAP